METSAINDTGVNEVFNTLAKKIYTAIEDGTMELRKPNRSIQLHMNNNDHEYLPGFIDSAADQCLCDFLGMVLTNGTLTITHYSYVCNNSK